MYESSRVLIYSKVMHLAKLIVIMPNTNAVMERTFGAIRYSKDLAQKYYAPDKTELMNDHTSLQ